MRSKSPCSHVAAATHPEVLRFNLVVILCHESALLLAVTSLAGKE